MLVHAYEWNPGNNEIVLSIALKRFFDIFNIDFYIGKILMEDFCKFRIDLDGGELIGMFNSFKDGMRDDAGACTKFKYRCV